jgi:hypothetical protein
MYTYIRCCAIAHNVGKQYKHSYNMYENFTSWRQNIVFAMNIIRTSHEAFARGLKVCPTVSKTDCHGTCGLVQRFLYTCRLYPPSVKVYTLKTEIYLSPKARYTAFATMRTIASTPTPKTHYSPRPGLQPTKASGGCLFSKFSHSKHHVQHATL